MDKSENMPWYQGPTFLYHLENVYVGGEDVRTLNGLDTAVATAWRAAQAAGEGDLVMVTGSLYAVGAARTACRRLGLLT